MNYKYLFIFLILLVLSIGAVSAQDNTSVDIISVEQDNNVLASNEYVIDDNSYDNYFDASTGKILENASISDGDTLLIGDVTNKEFNFNKNLTIKGYSPQSVATNSTFIVNGTVGFKITDLIINNKDMANVICAENAKDLTISNTRINMAFIDVSQNIDSACAILVDNGEHISIINNNLFINGYPSVCAVALTGEDINVSDSNIYSISTGNYSTGILLENYGSYDISNNYVFANAPAVAYAVKSQSNGSSLNATYSKNNIVASSPVAYAMYLTGSDEGVYQNTLRANGNMATGIASSADNLAVVSSTIYANGISEANVTSNDTLSPETVGVKIAGGNASFTDGFIETNGQYSVNASNAIATVANNYLKSALLFGDESVYHEGAASVYNNTPEYDAFLSGSDGVMYYRNGTRFTASLKTVNGTPIANKTLIFNINGESYNRTTDENGTAGMAINLKEGTYTLNATYTPGGNYSDISKSFTIYIMTTIEGENLIKYFRNGSAYYATFYDGKGNYLPDGTNVSFNINGVFYTRQINGSEGQAKLNINLDPDYYIITAINPINNETHSNNITVVSLISDNFNIVKYFKNSTQFAVTVCNNTDGKSVGEGENVTFNINGVFYTRQTNASGQAKLNINLQPGNYTITTIYNGCRKSNKITVLPILEAEDLVKKQGASNQFKVLLRDGQGKPYANQKVTFNINGVFYMRTTGSDGYAALNINLNAAADPYIITSSFNGTSISNKITIVKSALN